MSKITPRRWAGRFPALVAALIAIVLIIYYLPRYLVSHCAPGAGSSPRRRHARCPFSRILPGQLRRVSLPAYQQSLLNGMDRALAAGDPRLASEFAIFTLLTRDDGPPRTERLARGPSLMQRLLQVPVRVAKASETIPIALVAGLMAAIITLGIVTSRGGVCRAPATTAHQFGQIRTAACESSAHGLKK